MFAPQPVITGPCNPNVDWRKVFVASMDAYRRAPDGGPARLKDMHPDAEALWGINVEHP